MEDRTLLAGASLVNIQPNIDLSLTDGEVYHEAPQELTFVFSPGQQIDPDSLGGIQIVRSGSDGTFTDGNEVPIERGYVGIGNTPNEVIVRFASALPDDHYQITIFGTGVDALLNLNGEAFQDFNEDAVRDGMDQTINFELDLGAKVVAVVSQPVLREQVLSVSDVINPQDGDTFTITVGGASVTFEMDLDGGGLNDQNNISVVYTATEDASEIAESILEAFNSSLLGTGGYATITIPQNGVNLTISGDSFTPAISFALVNPGNPAFARADGNLVARDNQILVHFNDDDLNPDLANDPRFYQIIDTTTDEPLLTTDYTATYDALSDVTVLKLTSTSLNAGTQYRLRVGVSDTPNKASENYSTLGLENETISILAGDITNTVSTPVDGETSIEDLDLNDPSNLVIDGAGNYYFVHNDGTDVRILRVDHQTGLITIIAGDGTIVVGDDSPFDPVNYQYTLASSLKITDPRDMTLDAHGNLYFTDDAHVLKVDAVSQRVTVIAGGGIDDTPEPGDAPTDLQLDTPAQLAIDDDGNIYLHDSGAGQLIVIDGNSGLVLAALDVGPLVINDLKLDSSGNLFILTTGLGISPFSKEGIYIYETNAGSTEYTVGLSFDPNVFPTHLAGGGAAAPTDGVLTTTLNLSSVTDIAFDANGFLYYTDSTGYIVKFDPYADPADRTIEVIAGDGNSAIVVDGDPAIETSLTSPSSLAIGTGNAPYFFDNTDKLLRVVNLPDQNSSFDTATDLTDATHHWNAGTEEFIITSEIQAQGVGLPPLPGGTDEPGHRQLPATLDAHIGNSGTNPELTGSVSVIYYNFQDAYGSDVQGNQLHNAITEEQKARTREIFEIYAYYLGLEIVETADQGMTVVTGDLRVADASLPVGTGDPGGVSSGSTVIMDFSEYTDPADDVYGGSWMKTAFHEIGHSLGLGHAYDVPSIMSDDPLPQSGGQTVFPGDYDLDHLLRMYRADANDIDMYKFKLSESGTFRAEVFAERLWDSSLLNSVLTLFDEDHNIIARNDDYFSNDSFLELNLAAGSYFVGVTSTGNDNYNPEIENSGDNGTTDGEYELRLNFAPDPNSAAVTTDNGFVTDEDTPLSNSVFADNGNGTDSDPDASDVLSVSAVNGITVDVNSSITLASGALLTLDDDGNFIYDPNGAFDYLPDAESATDSFTYTIDDDNGGTDTATVTITINGLNDTPLAQHDTFQLNQTGTFTGDVFADNGNGADSDPDASDLFNVTQLQGAPVNVGIPVTLASGANLTLNSNGTFSYNPTTSAAIQALTG
ncbi:DVUA0089 family protein, partial [Gimesia sp.]|uniref:DVUA0089 family protein n=1 Tax=Gimesia sp. TaxID=2024833 RepID=UPI003A8D45C4